MLYFITKHNPFFAVKTENSLQIAENHKNSWKVREKLVEISRTVLHFHKLLLHFDRSIWQKRHYTLDKNMQNGKSME